jgi:multiple sugar transport system permease protein
VRKHAAPICLLAPFALLFAAFFLVPIGYAVYESLLKVERTGALGLGGSRTVFAGLENYTRALESPGFVDSLQRVLLFASFAVPLMVALSVALAVLLESASAYAPRFFRSAYFLPYGVPGVIASIMWGFLYVPGVSPIVSVLGDLGWDVDFLSSDTVLWSIANIVIWEFAGYNVLVVIAQLQAVPPELYEAARVDGASGWQVIRRIKLPLAGPAIVLVTVFTIIGTLQLFAEPLVLRPLSPSISNEYTPNVSAFNAAFTSNDRSLAAAEAVILALAACLLSFVFLRLVGRRGRA